METLKDPFSVRMITSDNSLNKQVLYSSIHAQHWYEPERQTMYSKWLDGTKTMTSISFKTEMLEWLKAIESCRPVYIFDICIDFYYAISSDEIFWAANILNAGMVEAGVKRYAHVIPTNLFAERSVELLFEEFLNMRLRNQYPIRHFVGAELAYAWLYETNGTKGREY